jgi:hypothetical protein
MTSDGAQVQVTFDALLAAARTLEATGQEFRTVSSALAGVTVAESAAGHPEVPRILTDFVQRCVSGTDHRAEHTADFAQAIRQAATSLKETDLNGAAQYQGLELMGP